RDELGLVRAVAVKARSSSQRKELFLRIQSEGSSSQPQTPVVAQRPQPCMLPVDMVVRWSSTFMLAHTGLSLKDSIQYFVFQMSTAEKDETKRKKLRELLLSDREWANLKEFHDILMISDNAQQAFSSETYPTLSMGIPALEAMHAGYTRKRRKVSASLHEAVVAALSKIEDYYDKTSCSDAYLVSMAVNPDSKFKHLRKHWTKTVYNEAIASLEKTFARRHKELEGQEHPNTAVNKRTSKLSLLMQELDNSDEESERDEEMVDPLAEPWKKDFVHWMEHDEIVPEKMDIVTWWGLNSQRYPTWAALALDHLPIMASSVSSEWAFSAAGITISKRRNRLKGDIVEALQVLKCVIRKDLIIRLPMPSSLLE
ncbi:hypothetical protein M422DRAFT_81167, partial [Sphaerobolus stellatus SS14]